MVALNVIGILFSHIVFLTGTVLIVIKRSFFNLYIQRTILEPLRPKLVLLLFSELSGICFFSLGQGLGSVVCESINLYRVFLDTINSFYTCQNHSIETEYFQLHWTIPFALFEQKTLIDNLYTLNINLFR